MVFQRVILLRTRLVCFVSFYLSFVDFVLTISCLYLCFCFSRNLFLYSPFVCIMFCYFVIPQCFVIACFRYQNFFFLSFPLHFRNDWRFLLVYILCPLLDFLPISTASGLGSPIPQNIWIFVDLTTSLPVLALGATSSASLCNLSSLVGMHGSASFARLSTLFPSLVLIILIVFSHPLLSPDLLRLLLALTVVLTRYLRLPLFIILFICGHRGVILMVLVLGLPMDVYGKISLVLILFIAIT